jgi:hypothetical protein
MVDAGERRSDQAQSQEKGNGVKGAEKKQRLSGSIEQKVRELWGENARWKRTLAKEAKAAERKKDREELASAKEFCRGLAANWPRPRFKTVVVSEAELRKLGGVKEMVRRKDGLQSRIIFGGVGETRLIFTPWHGAWMVELDAKPALEEELKRELNKSGRNLWNVPKPEQKPDIAATEQKPAVAEDKQKEKLDIAVQAVDALLAWSRDWQHFTALSKSEQKRAMIYAQLAILTTLQALKRDVEKGGRKLQLAFEWLTGEGSPSQIVKLCDHLRDLAVELQSPPSKKELKDRFDSTLPPQYPVHPSEFSKLVKVAGLSWLKRGKRDRAW